MVNTDPQTAELARPSLLIFDVNETLSDMSGLADAFAQHGADRQLAATWFAGLLRDGFALTVTGSNPEFAALAKESLTALLRSRGIQDVDMAVQAVMSGFTRLPVHSDVVEGVRALAGQGLRLVTLTNGAASVAEGLFERNGIADCFERLLSVEQAPAWKPGASAYEYALGECGVAAGEAMLVAVHPWDIHGAAAAGLSTAFLNRNGAPYPAYFSAPDVEVSGLPELATVLADGRPSSGGTTTGEPG